MEGREKGGLGVIGREVNIIDLLDGYRVERDGTISEDGWEGG